MNEVVYEILDSTTVFKFRQHFNTLESMKSPILSSWTALLDEACLVYRDLVLLEMEVNNLYNRESGDVIAMGRDGCFNSESQRRKPLRFRVGSNRLHLELQR